MVLGLRQIAPFLLVALLFLASPAQGQAQADPRIHADAKECLDALGIDPNDGQDRGTTCVVHYAHVDQWWNGPLNNQRPPDDIPFQMHGFNNPTLTPLWPEATFEFRLEGGGVEYHDGKVRTHMVPLAKPVELDGRTGMVFRLHLSVDQVEHHIAAPDVGEGGFIPCAHVEVHLGIYDRSNESFRSLTIGHATGHLANPGVAVPQMDCADPDDFTIDEQGVTSFDVRLPGGSILPPDRLKLLVKVYQMSETGERIGLQGVRLVHGPDHLNQLVLPVRDAIAVEDVDTLWYEDRLYVRTNVSSAFGMYDVDPDALRLDILDAEGNTVSDGPEVMVEEIIQTSYCHSCQGRPARAVFKVDLLGAELPDDTYRLRVTAKNLQHTAQASGEALLTLRNGGSVLTLYDDEANVTAKHLIREQEESPAVPLLLPPLLGLVGLSFLGRRRF